MLKMLLRIQPGGENSQRKLNGDNAMPKMKVAQVPKAGADFEIVEREIPQPGPGQVRIRAGKSCHIAAKAVQVVPAA